ncbi:MAG: bifunctional nicotinamidase/pyrazinamidase [Candidatus Omnitrophica bacterium]|nr:bifunctional nicotinamidase/pyrazinamidase [Candidatus Omnitrophota bacterium]
MKNKKALLIVDLQNDFCPAGALGVPGADKIVPVINRYVRLFSKKKLPIFASADWHPIRTAHFKDFGGRWPVHCIHNSRGAQFHPKLKLPKDAIVVYKGMDPQRDSYSVFQAEDKSGRSFLNILKILRVNELYVAGLATDYCVKYSVKDALKSGFKVRLLVDAIKGVDLKPKDSESAIKDMSRLGAKPIKIGVLKK